LPTGEVYWLQPILLTREGIQQWGTAVPFQLASSPVQRVEATLKFNATVPERSVKLTSKFEYQTTLGAEKSSVSDNLTMELLEVLEGTADGTRIKLALGKGEFSSIEKGAKTERNPDAQALVSKSFYMFQSDLNGRLIKLMPHVFTHDSFEVKSEAENLSSTLNSSYQSLALHVPNRLVKPLEEWPAKIKFSVGSGKSKVPVELSLTCTYQGLNDNSEALIRLNGELLEGSSGKPKDRITGYALFDLTSGYFA
jgi:hypothetical protein